MEVFAVDTLTGREEVVEIEADAMISAVKRRCGDAFGFGEDVELSVGGQRVACDNAERISNVAAFSSGCHVEVKRGVRGFVEQLAGGRITMLQLPLWARLRSECALAALKRRESRQFKPEWIHPSLYNNREVMVEFVRRDTDNFFRASESLRSDKEFILAVLEHTPELCEHVDKELQEDRDVAFVGVPFCKDSDVWLSDKKFVLEAIEKPGNVFQHASKELRDDKEVVMKALDWETVDFARIGKTMRKSKDVALKVLDKPRANFGKFPEILRKDKEVVMKALSQNCSWAATDIPKSLMQDKEVVMRMLDHKKCPLKRVSRTLRNDKEVVMKALEYQKDVFSLVSAPLRADKEVAMLTSKEGGSAFSLMSKALRGDEEMLLRCLGTRPSKKCIFKYASESLKGNKDVAMKAIQQVESGIFKHLSEALRGDKEVALLAVEVDSSAFPHMSEALRGDKEVVLSAADAGHEVLQYTSESLRADKEIAMRLFSRADGVHDHFRYLPESLRDDLEVALLAITDSPFNFSYAGERVRGNKEAALLAFNRQKVKGDRRVLLAFASDELQKDPEVVEMARAVTERNQAHAAGLGPWPLP
eukprot:TRINITY_DN830_c0_g1_i2.p1 TRINITY_DN830_c0_g1~~TRINITY_DN830_c0_g1_i2.p1  ORF type:complete len:590 (+),score=126.19 TRINITY_DN830_c0_g1_i2:107-1876(+)